MLRSPRLARTLAFGALVAVATLTTVDPRAGASAMTTSRVALEPIAEVLSGTAFATRPGDGSLYVATQRGLVVAITKGADPTTVLDLTRLTRAGGERGLLGLVFSPDGTKLYVHYSGVASGETVVEEYAFTGGVADPTTRRVVLTVPQPQANHNGGQLAFGPDGYLYLGLGDGGNADDEGPGHAPGGNGQSLATLLGKVLRIDPTPTGSAAYTIPADNPYADGGGRPEIYVYGVRNPWRFSFDRRTGDLWIADVGQDQFEEVTRLPAGDVSGANLGWNRYEGTTRHRDPDVGGTVKPQIVTDHADGNCSITGGFVYRGRAIPWLRGWYLYTDYCNGEIMAAKVAKNGTARERDLGISLPSVSTFGEDRAGELYVVSQEQGVFRLVPA